MKRILLLILVTLTFYLTTSAQSKKQSDNSDRTLKTETKVRHYYVDNNGKKIYKSESKTQKMWTEILKACPSCLKVAEDYNINIWENQKYVKGKPKIEYN